MNNARYDKIGKLYNLTRQADPYMFQKIYTLLKPSIDGIYLDIGCGTGNYTTLFQQKGHTIIGIDPSTEMLRKAEASDSKVIWEKAMAESMRLPHASIDGITAMLTIHHWRNLPKACKEINRVLKPNSQFVLFTSTPAQMEGYWLNHYFPKMLKDSINQMPDITLVKNHLKKNGFLNIKTERYFVKDDLLDHFLYCGKNRPHLYLNPQIRQGISSFSSLAHQVEIDSGLQRLEKDIKSNKIYGVISSYKNDTGDYLFLHAQSAHS